MLDWCRIRRQLKYWHWLAGGLLQGAGKVVTHQLHHGQHELLADFRGDFGGFDDGAGIALQGDGDGVGSPHK